MEFQKHMKNHKSSVSTSTVGIYLAGFISFCLLTACVQRQGNIEGRNQGSSESVVMDLNSQALGSNLTYQLYCGKSGDNFRLAATGIPKNGGATTTGSQMNFEFTPTSLNADDSCYLQGTGDPNNSQVSSFSGEKGVYLRSEAKRPVKGPSGILTLDLELIPQYVEIGATTPPPSTTTTGQFKPTNQTGSATGSSTNSATSTVIGTDSNPPVKTPEIIYEIRLNANVVACPINICQ